MFVIVDNHGVELVDQQFKLITFETEEEAKKTLEMLDCNKELFSVKFVSKECTK